MISHTSVQLGPAHESCSTLVQLGQRQKSGALWFPCLAHVLSKTGIPAGWDTAIPVATCPCPAHCGHLVLCEAQMLQALSWGWGTHRTDGTGQQTL